MPEVTGYSASSPPERKPPDPTWEYYGLWWEVRDVIKALPSYFRSSITVVGNVSATEIFTFGSAFASLIEAEVVRTLNETRTKWDPRGKYGHYEFARQAERFPDIILLSNKQEPVFGIELKSWYLLAKEEEPSPRFCVSAAVLAPPDLFVVVPWVLSNIFTGSPVVYEPYVELARYVAEYRNYWWQHLRKRRGKESAEITPPKDAKPYPSAREQINDVPASDRGKNFGRIARTGIMDEWIKSFSSQQLLGIPVQSWRSFFKKATRR